MNHEYRCVRCGVSKDSNIPLACPLCGDRMTKRFAFNTPGPRVRFKSHFNYSVGEYVTSMQDWRDKLKAKGDYMSKKMGIDHVYEEHDHGDRFGVVADDKGVAE